MKVFYISPIGYKTPLLFDTFSEFESVADVNDADVCFLDLHSRIGNYDQNLLDRVRASGIKICFFDFWDYGSVATYDFPDNNTFPMQLMDLCLNPAVGADKNIWFVRKLDKRKQYPRNVYPIECVQYPNHDFPLTTSAELFNREYDICWVGNQSPIRKSVVGGLLDAGFKMDIHWTNENGNLPHDEWLRRHRGAKLFMSLDSGGYSDERSYQLITISPMIKNYNYHLQRWPFVHWYSCIEVRETPDIRCVSSVKEAINNEEELFRLYTNGVNHMKKHYSYEARENYIHRIINGIS